MSFFRKKKTTTNASQSTQKSSTTSSTSSSSSTKIDENNVRVFSSTETKTMNSMTTKPNLPTTLDEGETYEDAEVFDRRSLKATARRQVSVQQPTTATSERMNKDDKVDEDDLQQGDEENKPLRSGPRSYGNARENTEGFYNARITVKDWQFNVDSIIVPVGCMILFSVDKSERSMVECNIQIRDVRILFFKTLIILDII